MPERLPQLVASAVDVGLDRAERKVQDFGDFFIRPPLDMTEQDAGAVLRAERSDRLLNGAAQLPRLDFLQRRLLPVPDLQRRRFDRLRGGGVGGPLEREKIQLAPPQMVNGGVVRDLE